MPDVQTSGSVRPPGPLEEGAGTRVLPFALAVLVAVVAISLPAAAEHPGRLAVAGIFAAAVFGSSMWVPWSRLPLGYQSLPAFAAFVLAALLRYAAGGSDSGLGVLVLIPVTWLALHGSRREVLLSLGCTAVSFVLPLVVVGEPTYTSADWRKTVVVTAMAALVALVVSRNVAGLAAGKRRAEELAAALAVTEANLAAVSAAGRELRTRDDVRPAIAESAAAIARAEMVMLMEPDGRGSLVQTAAVGFAIPEVHLPLRATSSGAVRAMVTGEPVFSRDAGNDTRVNTVLAQATGVRTALFEPLLRDGRAVGVLMVGWTTDIAEDGPRVAAARAYALEATVALERADDLQVLRRAAAEDPLTGAANRRSLEVVLAAELPVHGEAQRAVLMVDLDDFKTYNDRWGHAAGDLVLKEAVAAWRTALREGDLLARYGGEEFCIVLRGCGSDEVAAVAERIRAMTPSGATVSVGSACARPDEQSGELLLRADRALYRAKAAGRDRVVSAEVEQVDGAPSRITQG